MDFSNLALAGAFMRTLGVALAGMLAVARRKLYVFEDRRIDFVGFAGLGG